MSLAILQKNKIIRLVSLIFLFILLSPALVSAATCTVRAERVSGIAGLEGTAACDTRLNETKSDNDKCPGIDTSFRYQGLDRWQNICCCQPEDGAAVKSAAPKFDPPQLQIKIPGLDFVETDVNCINLAGGAYSCSINWIAKYVAAIYNYGLTIGGILAALMLMAGGLLWLTSGGDSGKVSKAKALIGGSITGLIILFSAYMILYQVNPELTVLKPITIGQIKDGAIGDSSIPVSPSTFTDGKSLFLTITGINCGVDSYPEMMKKAKGKIVYSQAKRMTAAPSNKIYMDCSSFANLITVCAGKAPVPDYTETMFTNQARFNGNINSLIAGDLIGWKKSDASVSKNGHVYIYLGNGRFGDANGSSGIGDYSLSHVLQATERHTGQSVMPYMRRP